MIKPEFEPVSVVEERTRRVLFRCYSVKEAEAFIAGLEEAWPISVHRGDFGIDAPEELVNPSPARRAAAAQHMADLFRLQRQHGGGFPSEDVDEFLAAFPAERP